MPESPMLCTGMNGIHFRRFGGIDFPKFSLKVFDKPRPLGGESHVVAVLAKAPVKIDRNV